MRGGQPFGRITMAGIAAHRYSGRSFLHEPT
jgi:hypothetical protein